MKVVIVESPAKAKTINKYLGSDYKVVASFGHVRDLPSKNGSVDPDHNFQMTWEIESKSEKHLQEIGKLVKGATDLYLATDPDREGEAISWHICEILKERKLLKNINVHRIVFHEITKNAIQAALANPRAVNQELVEAYLARRAMDYLVGFTLSPVLWRKLPGSKSAGRVQSVALRLITDRESEIEAFKTQEYWTVEAGVITPQNKTFKARLTHLDGKKLEKFSLPNQTSALAAAKQIESSTFTVAKIERKTIRRNPPPPFTTSTLQQEASRKLGYGASRTMQIAQKLYEGIDIGGETVGLITYMRTDSTNISQEAMVACRQTIETTYGKPYVPAEPRYFKNKIKNAQEAHEAIRPTSFGLPPEKVVHALDDGQRKLYELIWKRMLASQMSQAEVDQISVDIANTTSQVILRATGSTITFDGFLKLYQEGRDDDDRKEPKTDEELQEGDKWLPAMDLKEAIGLKETNPEQHFTQPPPRYTEASLVKKLEELGIGRPSTYASIIQVLQGREYVKLERKQFIPQARGRVVTAFLINFFKKYVEYDFTASLEEELDHISNGDRSWQALLNEFWSGFKKSTEDTKDLRISEVLETLDRELALYLFPPAQDREDSRSCPSCKVGQLSLKLSKFGAFIGCERYPDCTYTHKLDVDANGGAPEALQEQFPPKVLGSDPVSGKEITLKRGPYGFYVEWTADKDPLPVPEPEEVQEDVKGKKKKAPKAKKPPKPKRVAIPAGVNPEELTLEEALSLGALPKELGIHPETGLPMIVGIGRFGPYIKYQDKFTSIPKSDDPMIVTVERAVEILQAAANRPPRPKRTFGKKKAAD